MLGYILPTGNGKRVLWYPPPRLAWGELKGLGDEVVLLSPEKDIDLNDIPLLTHDNIYRPVVRRSLSRKFVSRWTKRLMLWGVIWLVGMDRPLEDVVSGLYLFFGLPLFAGLSAYVYKLHEADRLDRFSSLFHVPNVKIVFSPRLYKLEKVIEEKGLIAGLDILDELGLGHLREFWKRGVWSERWYLGPPTGAGVLLGREDK